MKQQILGLDGKPVMLNAAETARASALQKQYDRELKNALGAEINITTLTQISKRIVEQKFFEVAPADYLPVRVGEGAWSSEILTYKDYSLGGDFTTGIINTGGNDSRIAEVDAGVEGVRVPIINWAKGISYSMFDLQMAARSGNWDLVTSKERSRKRNWDLGIQRIAFLGIDNNTNARGLLTLPNVNSNTSLITKNISAMTASEFNTFVQGVIAAYRANAQYTAMPDVFTIPEADYTGLVAPVAEGFPVVSKLEYLLNAFRTVTMNPNFQIRPIAYANKAQNANVPGLNKNRYVLYRYDEDTMRMDIPVDYTNTLQNTINGFQFQNVGYGQFTGAVAFRPLEVLYFDWS